MTATRKTPAYGSLRVRWWLGALLGMIAWATCMPVQADGLHLDPRQGLYELAEVLTVYKDDSAEIELPEVRQARAQGHFVPTQPVSGEINFGYSGAAYWLHVALAPGRNDPNAWRLEIAFPWLDRVDVYQLGPQGLVAHHTVGDRLPFSTRPIPHRYFVFPLHADATEIYIRVHSGGSLTIPVRIWHGDAFQAKTQSSYVLLSLYFGMLLALLLYNLIIFVAVREGVFLYYVCFVLCMAVAQASLDGLANQYLWPEWPRWGNVALPCGMAATGFFAALFTRAFLSTATVSRWLDRLILAMAALFAFCALSPAFMPYRFSAIATSLAGSSFSIVAIFSGLYCLMRGQHGARYFVAAWTVLLIGVGMLGLRNLAWLPTNWLTTYGMQVGSALEMLLLSFALADRFIGMRRDKERAQAEALTAQQELVVALRRSEQELEQQVRERTDGLERANAKLRENELELQRMAHRDPLTGLANRALLYDRLEHALAQRRRDCHLLAVLLIDLDGFKPINDRYGHAVGDQLLVELAQRLRYAVRQGDTVARLGGDEFVVVLEQIADIETAEAVAAKLIAEVARAYEHDALLLNITASIGIAAYPIHADEPHALLKYADEAMYRAKRDGRNAYRRAEPQALRRDAF